MKTRKEQMTTKGSFDNYQNFSGDDSEYQDWYGVIGRSRDSDILEECNFERIVLNLNSIPSLK